MIFTSEQVSNGHPDKICDQISDAILTECLRQDEDSRVAVECLIKDYDIVIGGEVTTAAIFSVENIVKEVLQNIGLEDVNKYNVLKLMTAQSQDIAQGVDTGGAGDQGIMFGYATNETEEMLPIPFVLATAALQILKEKAYTGLKPDAKSQVSYDYEKGRIDTFLISVQHDENLPDHELRDMIIEVMYEVAKKYNTNQDFKILINPTGRFVVGSSFADTGVTGRKIIADSYGGVARHGGGAFSGKDPSKVDRSAAYMARKIAKDIVRKKYCDRCEIQVGYAIGVNEPVSIHVETFGTEKIDKDLIELFIKESYDLRPKSIIQKLGLKKSRLP